MREIKFRAWDKVNKEMTLHNSFYELQNWCRSVKELLYFEIMQWTGLKDKNGKEIYEGDILNWDSTGSGDENIISKVQWSENYAMFTVDFDDPLGFEFIEEIEVIGNIYENPGLIK